MRSVKLFADRNISKGLGSAVGKSAPKRPQLVHMGRALKETQGIGRGLEFLAFPKGA